MGRRIGNDGFFNNHCCANGNRMGGRENIKLARQINISEVLSCYSVRCEEDIETDDGLLRAYWCMVCREFVFLREDNAEE